MNIPKSYFAGIGSRTVPPEFYSKIKLATEIANNKGYNLRSGGAIGSDSLFEKYNTKDKQIFLPCKNHNNNLSPLYKIPEGAFKIAQKYHPKWDEFTNFTRRLLARNAQIILGENLDHKVDFVLFYTENEKIIGGTGHSLRIALDYGIPCYYIGSDIALESLRNYNVNIFE